MSGEPAAALTGGIILLERAITYTLGSLNLVSPEDLGRATPCAVWNLNALLWHLDDSIRALDEAIHLGRVEPDPPDGGASRAGQEPCPVTVVRDRACRLLGTWVSGDVPHHVSIAGRPLPNTIVASTGAVEIVVHGWDVARACLRDRPIPPSLAEEMLQLSALFVTDDDRPVRFAPRVAVSPLATASDRLVAFLGRHP